MPQVSPSGVDPETRIKMPIRKRPCDECRGKHLKCSEDKPKCSRCRDRDLECVRNGSRTAFRQGTLSRLDSQFPDSQTWVTTNARGFRQHTGSRGRAKRIATDHGSPERRPARASSPSPISPQPISVSNESQELAGSHLEHTFPSPHQLLAGTHGNTFLGSSDGSIASLLSPVTNYTVREDPSTPAALGPHSGVQPGLNPVSPELVHCPSNDKAEGTSSTVILEACLLHYYVEELSHWFDTCDRQRRFEYLVPERARSYPPLLNAIYAVSARHMCRLPKYRTDEGIEYRGQLLRTLTPETSVEYMLKCMPALRAFHDTYDEDTRVLMVTTAVILRQFEEMEHDDEEENDISSPMLYHAADSPSSGRVNFLSIINAALRSSHARVSFLKSDLLNVCYWIALRQEVYDALLRGYPPEMDQTPQKYGEVSPSDRLIMHASHVTRWMFEGRSEEGWLALKKQEETLENEVASQFQPLLVLPPNRERGQVFPTIWFRSVTALTGMQHLMIAKMILIAESPFLGQSSNYREAYRKVEGDVRTIVLEICGTSLQDEKTTPSIVNAALAIHLYGHFFIDWYERKALKGVIQRFSDARAWPVPKALREFQLST